MSRAGNGSAAQVAGHAYCYTPPPVVTKKKKKKGKKATTAKKRKKRRVITLTGPSPLTVLSAPGAVGTTVFSTASATTAPCADPLQSISGGFSTPQLAPTTGALIVEARRTGAAWTVTGVQAGFPAQSEGPITAFNDCA